MKHCPYCLAPHERRRARYCCAQHMRRANAQRAAATMRLRRIMVKIDRLAKHRARVRPHWRQLALGVNANENVRAIFGVLPADEVRDPAA